MCYWTAGRPIFSTTETRQVYTQLPVYSHSLLMFTETNNGELRKRLSAGLGRQQSTYTRPWSNNVDKWLAMLGILSYHTYWSLSVTWNVRDARVLERGACTLFSRPCTSYGGIEPMPAVLRVRVIFLESQLNIIPSDTSPWQEPKSDAGSSMSKIIVCGFVWSTF